MSTTQRPSEDADEGPFLSINPLFTSEPLQIPRFRIPDNQLAPDVAEQIVHDELLLDGQARLNLATFVTTWAEPQVGRLMSLAFAKNIVDKDEYPQTAALEQRCVRMLADLWNAPDPAAAVGTSTVGSSEACMFGGLALKRKWQLARRAKGLPTDQPNLVMGINVQVCWEKFADYFEVAPRQVPMQGNRFHLEAAQAVAQCDENTIGVVVVLGSTFDGSYEPVADICAALDDLQKRTGLDIPVHVDAASGGFIAPFLDPELEWDFRLKRVVSINTSGHKYGLVYPGVGWAIWRDASALPQDLVFNVNYLGGQMPTFSLNFSRPGGQVIAQYYNFIRLGFEGYSRVQQTCRDVAVALAEKVAALGPFELLTHGKELPVFVFAVADGTPFSVFDVSMGLREFGWQVPAYTFPADREDISVLRIVIRNGVSHDLTELLFGDLQRVVERLSKQQAPVRGPETESFAHGLEHGKRVTG